MAAGPPVRRRKRAILPIAGAAVALVAAYVFLAVIPQPLAAGSSEGLTLAPGQTRVDASALETQYGPLVNGRADAVTYVDGESDFLIKEITNTGPVTISVTGVEITPQWMGGLMQVRDPRKVLMKDAHPCCDWDLTRTWSQPGFTSFELSPGAFAVIGVRLLMSDCEISSPGVWEGHESITVDYGMLGFPHRQTVSVGPIWIESPNSCPRSRA